jgi:hypothetical protein
MLKLPCQLYFYDENFYSLWPQKCYFTFQCRWRCKSWIIWYTSYSVLFLSNFSMELEAAQTSSAKKKVKKKWKTFEVECILTEVEFLGLKVYPVDSALRFSSSRNEWLIFTSVCTVSSDSSYLLCNWVRARGEDEGKGNERREKDATLGLRMRVWDQEGQKG